MNKKILWIIVLVFFIVGIIAVVSLANSSTTEKIASTVNNKSDIDKRTEIAKNTVTFANKVETESGKNLNKDYIRVEMDDGILYSVDGNRAESDLVIGDNYFDTTISYIYLNPEEYVGKNIEVEGMYLENLPYTFVGRYSTSSLCPYCPSGYSYIEYEFLGDIQEKLVDEQTWIKIIGKLEVGNDATTNYTDYYYLNVLNFEIMNERGNDTVNN